MLVGNLLIFLLPSSLLGTSSPRKSVTPMPQYMASIIIALHRFPSCFIFLSLFQIPTAIPLPSTGTLLNVLLYVLDHVMILIQYSVMSYYVCVPLLYISDIV